MILMTDLKRLCLIARMMRMGRVAKRVRGKAIGLESIW